MPDLGPDLGKEGDTRPQAAVGQERAPPAAHARRRPFHRRAARHVGRGAHHLLRWFGALAAILILVALFGIWRLMQGPIALNWLAPYAEAAIARSGAGLRLTFSGVQLGIDRRTRQLDLFAEDVRVASPDGTPVARFPELSTSFSLGELLRGRLEPTQVAVNRPSLYLVRDAGGAITTRIGSKGAATAELGPAMIENLAGPRAPGTPLGLLSRLDIRNARVVLDDVATGRTWRADRVDLAVNRSAKGVRGDFSLAVPLAGSLPELHVNYRYFADRQVLDLDMSVAGVQPTKIPPLIPELAQLQHVDAPVSGTLRTRIDLRKEVAQGSRLDLSLGPGRVRSEFLPNGSIAIDKGELHAIYAPESATVRLDRLALDLGGGSQLVLDGTVSGVTPALVNTSVGGGAATPLAGQFNASLTDVPVARFASLWPSTMSRGGRRWTIANIHDGVLDEGALQLAVELDPAGRSAVLRGATGTLRYHNLTVNYLDGLSPARGVGGTAKFAGKQLDFFPTAGTLKRLKITGGDLQITHIGEKTEWLRVDIGVAGPLRDALEVIDEPRLGYAKKIGLDPAQVGGTTEAHLHFNLPLIVDLKLDQLEYGATATIHGADLGNFVMKRPITAGDFALDLGHAGVRLQGNARFDGVPTRLEAMVYFQPGKGVREKYRAGLTLDGAARRRLGFDFAPDRIQGPIAAAVNYAAYAEGRAHATAQLDLREAALTVPEAGWKKPPSQPGTATIEIDLDHGKIAAVPRIAVRAAGLDGNFAASLDPRSERIERVDIRRLAVAGSDLAGAVTRAAGGGWHADLTGGQLDARHLVKEVTNAAPTPPSQPGQEAGSAPLAIEARFERVLLAGGRPLDQVQASLARTGGLWQAASLDGKFADGRRLALRLGQGGGHRLYVQSDDFGALLKLLDITGDVTGGNVTLDGQLSQGAGGRHLKAHLDARSYTLAHAPWMARLLALPSFTGIASLLSGAGLPFSLLQGDFTYNGGQIALERVLASGEALGVTAKGWVDLDRDQIDLQGTIAPVYMLNSIVGRFPIVGRLLGGGDQGLFAANFRLSGEAGDPQVSVNPLSALAPGILRKLFLPFGGSAPVAPK